MSRKWEGFRVVEGGGVWVRDARLEHRIERPEKREVVMGRGGIPFPFLIQVGALYL